MESVLNSFLVSISEYDLAVSVATQVHKKGVKQNSILSEKGIPEYIFLLQKSYWKTNDLRVFPTFGSVNEFFLSNLFIFGTDS